MSERCQCCQISKCPSLLNICSEQSEQSGRLTDPPPGSFLIPQQLAVPPVPQIDEEVPCPKTIGEPGTPKFPEAGHVKYVNLHIDPSSLQRLSVPRHLFRAAMSIPWLQKLTQHTNKSMLTTSTFVHSSKQLCCSFQHYMCIGATNTKGTYTGQRTSTLNTMLSNSLFDSSKIHSSGLRKLEVR